MADEPTTQPAESSAENAQTPQEVKAPDKAQNLNDQAQSQATTEKKPSRFSKLRAVFSRKKKVEPMGSSEDVEEKHYDTLVEAITKQDGDDYWTVRVSKKLLFWLVGVLIVGMWGWYLYNLMPEQFIFFWSVDEATESGQVETAPVPESTIRVRVRSSAGATASASMASILEEADLFEVEIVDEATSSFSGVSVIAKRDDMESRIIVSDLLSTTYELSSPSAELTDDSDFDVVVLMGE